MKILQCVLLSGLSPPRLRCTPETQGGKEVDIRLYIDSDHTGDAMTRNSI